MQLNVVDPLTLVPEATPKPTFVVAFQTNAVKWPVPDWYPGLLKSYREISLYQELDAEIVEAKIN